jgi:hypothetical protein
MSEIDPELKTLQKPQKDTEAAPPATPRLEDRQKQLSSPESELNAETNVAQNPQMLTQALGNETEKVEPTFTKSKHREPLETPLKANQENTQTQPDPLIAVAGYPPTSQQLESQSPLTSQQSPLTLETLYQELKLLRGNIQQLQNSLESQLQGLATQIDSLREEVATSKQQQTATIDLPRDQTDRKRKQTQSSSLPQTTPEKKQARGRKHDFNTVVYLQEHGEAKLREELEKKANTELIQIVRSDGSKVGKELKSVEREEVIKEILLSATRRLKQGSVFLKN